MIAIVFNNTKLGEGVVAAAFYMLLQDIPVVFAMSLASCISKTLLIGALNDQRFEKFIILQSKTNPTTYHVLFMLRIYL